MSAVAASGSLAGPVARWFENYRSALAHRGLRFLLGGLLVSWTGNWAYNVALLAFVYDRTHSFGWVGAAGFVRLAAAVVCSPYGGVIADRVERTRLMVNADLVCALWQAGIAVTAAAGGPVVVVVILAALTSATYAVYPPAVAATIPSVVEEQDLVAANALQGTIDNLVVIAGPSIGAGLLLLGAPALAFGANAASFVISALLVSRIRVRSRPVDVTEAAAAGALGQMATGVRTIASLRAARTLVAFSILVSFVYGTDTVLFIAVSSHRLGTGTAGFGYLMAGLGIGGIAMAVGVDRIGRSSKLAPIILGGTVGYCLPTALLTVIHSPELAFVVQVIRGGSTLVVDVLAITALQRSVPNEQLARVFGIFWTLVPGAIALGALLTPPVISALGLDGALFTMALVPTALGFLGLPALLAVDRESAERVAELAPRVALLEQVDIFATANRPLLERLASTATEVNASGGAVILSEGQPADALYLLAAGQVQVTAHGEPGGVERPVRALSAPSYFGEIGVLEHIPRTATVTAVTDCRCQRIDGSTLLDALATTPGSVSLMENLRSRVAVTHPSLHPAFGQDFDDDRPRQVDECEQTCD